MKLEAKSRAYGQKTDRKPRVGKLPDTLLERFREEQETEYIIACRLNTYSAINTDDKVDNVH